MSASVKIMLSYDYCHFEVSKSSDEDLTDQQINEMRKDVQRLADEAVRQFKESKRKAALKEEAGWKADELWRKYKLILEKPEGERTVNELAIVKQMQDEQWRAKMMSEYDYDYDDDDGLY